MVKNFKNGWTKGWEDGGMKLKEWQNGETEGWKNRGMKGWMDEVQENVKKLNRLSKGIDGKKGDGWIHGCTNGWTN